MTEHGTRTPTDDLQRLMNSYSHVRDYIEEFYEEHGEYPIVVDEEEVEEYDAKYPNIIYRVDDEDSEMDDGVFVHVFGDRGITIKYYSVEPVVEDKELYDRVLNSMHKNSGDVSPPDMNTRENREEYVRELLDFSVVVGGSGIINRVRKYVKSQVSIPEDTYDRLRYTLERNIAGLGEIDIIMKDSNNEDIHLIGHDKVNVDHGAFGLINTDVQFDNEVKYDTYLRNMGERMESPISDSNPIVDSTLPDGSRVNIVYSDDISIKGPTVTIRQGTEVPLSIFQITKWNTLSPKMAAYLWLCLENEQTVFVIGETASGKTTTLNSIMSFIPRDSKIYTAEDTAEVLPPHDTWQQLLTRESGDESGSDVEMSDLVESALRARPDYIIVGEVRGEEAKQAFNAAQTGHPVMLTFHASDIQSAIQRFNNDPMNVPKSDIVNADVMLFQNRVKGEDGEIKRRVTEVNEIAGYDGDSNRIVNKQAFKWIASKDEHEFTGMNKSYVLEERIARLLGYEDVTKIYDELNRREEIIKRFIENDVVGYHEVNNVIETIQADGIESIDVIETSDLIKQ